MQKPSVDRTNTFGIGFTIERRWPMLLSKPKGWRVYVRLAYWHIEW